MDPVFDRLSRVAVFQKLHGEAVLVRYLCGIWLVGEAFIIFSKVEAYTTVPHSRCLCYWLLALRFIAFNRLTAHLVSKLTTVCAVVLRISCNSHIGPGGGFMH